jgi:Asp-tRNA(Asn)/Glu-tRNA(Gln) amidotransferase A subunit family amidase
MSIAHAETISGRDSAALLDATAGPELGSPYWAPPQQRPFLNELGVDPGKLRIAVVLDSPTAPFDRECAKAAAEAAKLCAITSPKVRLSRKPQNCSKPLHSGLRSTFVQAKCAGSRY